MWAKICMCVANVCRCHLACVASVQNNCTSCSNLTFPLPPLCTPATQARCHFIKYILICTTLKEEFSGMTNYGVRLGPNE